jgi:diguanylate cyclase (GGDEF)-like protein
MQTVDQTTILKVKLLASIDLDEAAATTAEIVTYLCQAEDVAILMWDADLESFGEKFFFGPRKKDLLKLCEAYLKQEDAEADGQLEELELTGQFSKELAPVHCYRVTREDALCACLLICGADELDPKTALIDLQQFAMAEALLNAWEYRELKRENERLRSQYEEMEDKVTMLESETRKLIHDTTARETMRMKQVERERLIYWISNAVRSSVHIQRVLENTVEKIGVKFGVSRCLLLRSVDGVEQVQVYEFAQDSAPSVKELFFTDHGFEFTRKALNTTVPQVLEDPEQDEESPYDRLFLKQFGLQSGLIVPLVMRENVLGVLFLQDCVHRREWSIDDISFFDSLADNLSVAIENAELHQERERQAVTDGLTGVANRRSFNEMLAREFERARRYEQPLSLVVIDLDHLKKINDTYGHQAGDEAIRSIGTTLRQSCRSVDLPARYGGEEFTILLPNTGIDMALELAERLRRLINEVEVTGAGKISASLGVATYPLHADDADLLFQRADDALYRAKQAGRNQVSVAVPAPHLLKSNLGPVEPGSVQANQG